MLDKTRDERCLADRTVPDDDGFPLVRALSHENHSSAIHDMRIGIIEDNASYVINFPRIFNP